MSRRERAFACARVLALVCALACALVCALVGCGTSPGPAAQAGAGSAVREQAGLPAITQDAGREAIQDTTQEPRTVTASAAALASANDSFEYKVGNPSFHGRTIVRVTGDGKAEVSFEQGGKTQHYRGTVPAAKLTALRESLTTHPIERYRPGKRSPVPDEATMELTVVTGGTRTEARILDGERHQIDALGELVDVVQEIASKVSGGKVEY
jgi:hypothetical protein